MKCLLDLRFADDILLFAHTSAAIAQLLDDLVVELSALGLQLNASKTAVLTTEAQPAEELLTQAGLTLHVLPRSAAHKWLGCMLSSSGRHTLDIDYHLQAACKAFYSNVGIMTDRSASISSRLAFFDKVVTPAALFAGIHRTMYKSDLNALDVAFRRLARKVVGPPGGLDWSRPWHETLHSWHERLYSKMEHANLQHWSSKLLRQYWRFAAYLVGLPGDRWLYRVFKWSPQGVRSHGRPHNAWDDLLVAFWRIMETLRVLCRFMMIYSENIYFYQRQLVLGTSDQLGLPISGAHRGVYQN